MANEACSDGKPVTCDCWDRVYNVTGVGIKDQLK